MTLAAHLPRYPLAFLPTPLHPLPRLSLADSSFQPASGSGSNATTRPALPAAATRRASWSCCLPMR